MFTRRAFGKLMGATALGCGCGAAGFIAPAAAQGGAQGAPARGGYLIRNGAGLTVDPGLGTLPRAALLVPHRPNQAGGARPPPPPAPTTPAAHTILRAPFVATHHP